jgi:hypothetical protein
MHIARLSLHLKMKTFTTKDSRQNRVPFSQSAALETAQSRKRQNKTHLRFKKSK